jgi:hypothetical protein
MKWNNGIDADVYHLSLGNDRLMIAICDIAMSVRVRVWHVKKRRVQIWQFHNDASHSDTNTQVKHYKLEEALRSYTPKQQGDIRVQRLGSSEAQIVSC